MSRPDRSLRHHEGSADRAARSSAGTHNVARHGVRRVALTVETDPYRAPWCAMHPRSYNYLNNVQNSLGEYVYRDELSKGTLLGYPFAKSTQIPARSPTCLPGFQRRKN
jgi:hypothetical protein